MELAPGLLVCPACRRLVHRERLESLAAGARSAEAAGEPGRALVLWREALELLPAGAEQAIRISDRIIELRELAPADAGGAGEAPSMPSGPTGRAARILAPLGVAGLLLWKLKGLLVLVAGKGKLLLVGLTKAGTLSSMLASFGVYWAIWGWPLAAGILLSIYVHEIGHVAAMKQLGMTIDAPMVVPGVGAFIRLRHRPVDAIEDARIGLAGPVWGLGAALVALALWRASGSGLLLAIARLGAWINLFNLLPLGPLDGGRAFRALARPGRWLAAGALLVAWSVTKEGLLLLLLVVAAFRAFAPADAPRTCDRGTLLTYVLLVAALSSLATWPAGP